MPSNAWSGNLPQPIKDRFFYGTSWNLKFNYPNVGILAPLFMLNCETVHKAVANLAIDGVHETPIVFGPGWFSFALTLLMPVLGASSNVLPTPEIRDMKVMNMKSGQSRTNNSYILSRLLRDLEKDVDAGTPTIGGLSVTVVDAIEDKVTHMTDGQKQRHLSTWIEWAVLFLQTLVAALPFALHRNQFVLIYTLFGLLLANATLRLPVWTRVKYAARKNRNGVYALMRGNGNRHVVIVRNKALHSYNLEDMAAASAVSYNWKTWEGGAAVLLALGWFMMFVMLNFVQMTEGNNNEGAYLLAVMTIGYIGNTLTAALPRRAAFHGFHLDMEKKQTFATNKVMPTLAMLESAHEGYGEKLLDTFFPGGLSEKEKVDWKILGELTAEGSKTKMEEEKNEREEAWKEEKAKLFAAMKEDSSSEKETAPESEGKSDDSEIVLID